MNDSKLIRCKSCDAEIAKSAPACPKCGGINEWIHPAFKAFAERTEEIDLGGREFVFHAYRDKITGEAVPRWRPLQQFVYTLGVVVVSAIFGTMAVWNDKKGAYILFYAIQALGGVYLAILAGAMIVWFFSKIVSDDPFSGMNSLWNEGFFGCASFELDLSGAQPVWESDNDEFWEPVRKALFAKL